MNNYRNDFNDIAREVRWTFGKLFLFLFVPVFLITSISGGIWHFIMKPVEVLDKVTDPDRMIGQYEWFIQQDKDIKAIDQQISNSQIAENKFKDEAGPREKWTHDDREEYSRLSSITVGCRQSRLSMIADYNSRSDQNTRSFLKSHSLPEKY